MNVCAKPQTNASRLNIGATENVIAVTLAMNKIASQSVTVSRTSSNVTTIVASKKCGFATEMMIVVTDLMSTIVVNASQAIFALRQNSNVRINVNAFLNRSSVMVPMIAVTDPMKLAVFSQPSFSHRIPTALSNRVTSSN